MGRIETCPTCGSRVEYDLYLGWVVDAKYNVIPESPAIFHTGLNWCGHVRVAQLGVEHASPCDMPVDDPDALVNKIAHTYGERIADDDVARLRELAHRIAAHQRATGQPPRIRRA